MKVFWSISLAVYLVAAAAAQQPSSSHARPPFQPFDGDATLAYYLRQADWVVVATLKTPVDGFVGGGVIGRAGDPLISAAGAGGEKEGDQVLKGHPPETPLLLIDLCFLYVNEGGKPVTGIVKFPPSQPENPAPFGYRQGAKYIFFLRALPTDYKSEYNGKSAVACTADPWMGCLPYSDALALGLRQVATASK